MNIDRETVLTRTVKASGKKFWFSAITRQAFELEGKMRWSNCLYLHFAKEDFPTFKSPPLNKCDSAMWGREFRFDYAQSKLNDLSFHGGITFYEETTVAESNKTFVKVGCDYSHLYDDYYMDGDHGLEILAQCVPVLTREFEQLVVPEEIEL